MNKYIDLDTFRIFANGSLSVNALNHPYTIEYLVDGVKIIKEVDKKEIDKIHRAFERINKNNDMIYVEWSIKEHASKKRHTENRFKRSFIMF